MTASEWLKINNDFIRDTEKAIRDGKPHGKEMVVVQYSKQYNLNVTPVGQYLIMWNDTDPYCMRIEVQKHRVVSAVIEK